ncbi:MAG: isoprenyl transferase [Candidatus Omnitrophica bacterium]|nr:isoprenyl transferase [Candidatus Omnitrophota bacterium]
MKEKEKKEIPAHIAIILDGNGRWALNRGLPRTAGHREGVKRVKEIVRSAKELGVRVLTIFAFSTENWNRPQEELKVLFSYLDRFLEGYKEDLQKNDIRLRILGRRDRLKKSTVRKIEEVEQLTAGNCSFLFQVALDYGGRWDIVQAARRVAGEVSARTLREEDIDAEAFRARLAMGDVRDPDLLIRTSGEQRISNFLLWYCAYTEFYFSDILWPDFDREQLARAVESYRRRERRYGEV